MSDAEDAYSEASDRCSDDLFEDEEPEEPPSPANKPKADEDEEAGEQRRLDRKRKLRLLAEAEEAAASSAEASTGRETRREKYRAEEREANFAKLYTAAEKDIAMKKLGSGWARGRRASIGQRNAELAAVDEIIALSKTHPDHADVQGLPWFLRDPARVRNGAPYKSLPAVPAEPAGFETAEDFAAEKARREAASGKYLFHAFRPSPTRDFAGDSPAPTGMHCQHCTEPIEGPPVPRPVNGSNLHYGNAHFNVGGQFCSIPCSLRYTQDRGESLGLSVLLFRALYGKACVSTADIHKMVAPPREALAKFGGVYSLEEFRGASVLGVRVQQQHAPLLSVAAGFAEEYNSHSTQYFARMSKAVATEVTAKNTTQNNAKKQRTASEMRAAPTEVHDTGIFRSAQNVADMIEIARARAKQAEIDYHAKLAGDYRRPSVARTVPDSPAMSPRASSPVMSPKTTMSPPPAVKKQRTLANFSIKVNMAKPTGDK